MYIRFLVEEAEHLDIAPMVRWFRREAPHWPKVVRDRWPLTEPLSRVPLDPLDKGHYQDEVKLAHLWSRRWNAPIYFFLCPRCHRRVRRLLRLDETDVWACRLCHRAKYVSQLQSTSRLARGWEAASQYLDWRLSRPGPKPRSVARLARQVARAEEAFDGDAAWLMGYFGRQLDRVRSLKGAAGLL